LRRLRRAGELEWLLWLSVLPVVDVMVFPATKSFYDSGFLVFFAEHQLLCSGFWLGKLAKYQGLKTKVEHLLTKIVLEALLGTDSSPETAIGHSTD
jgi:hypothetical protein